jgi:hypothetical protein
MAATAPPTLRRTNARPAAGRTVIVPTGAGTPPSGAPPNQAGCSPSGAEYGG